MWRYELCTNINLFKLNLVDGTMHRRKIIMKQLPTMRRMVGDSSNYLPLLHLETVHLHFLRLFLKDPSYERSSIRIPNI